MRITDLHSADFVDWLRHAAPYINAHRGRTFVIHFPGSALYPPALDGLVHDLALLTSLGVRLVLVPGARSQVEERLRQRGLTAHYASVPSTPST
ncbi:amino-acid N-acetyltransferase, partial [Halorhodospira abdelmalekii]|nr:amino-acid N-acetyltransferase [Halorhodospira abdelmalekii]